MVKTHYKGMDFGKNRLQGVGTMISSKLRQTTFHIEELRHIVGSGNATAYQIYTTPGKPLGRLGVIANQEQKREPANDRQFANQVAGQPPNPINREGFSSWLRKTMAALRR